MKYLLLLSFVSVIYGQFPQVPQVPMPQVSGNGSQPSMPGVDLPGMVIAQVSTLTQQLNGLQAILQSLNQQFSGMIRTTTRLVEGLQSEGGLDIANPMNGLTAPINSIMSAFNQMTSQFSMIQRTISDLTSNFQRMIASGTRVIGGGAPLLNDNSVSLGETITRNMEEALRQMESTAATLRDLNSQLSRIIESSSRLVSGLQETATAAPGSGTGTENQNQQVTSTQTLTNTTTITDGGTGTSSVTAPVTQTATNPAGTLLKGVEIATEQVGAAQKIATELTQQLSKLVQTGAKVVTGNRDVSPVELGLNSLAEVTRQFSALQSVVRNLNNQFNRMIESGTKMVTGGSQPLFADTDSTASGPAQIIETTTRLWAEQAQSLQKTLAEMTQQLTRMLGSGSRVITGNPSGLNRVKRADAKVVEALQVMAADMTRQIGSMGATLARIAGGATGIRALGGGSSVRDGASNVFGNLNPIAAIGRQVGNIAGSLTRVLPTSG